MGAERTIDGWQLRLRPHGMGRYVSGAFLACWLCGWAVGETLVLGLLVKGGWALLTGTPPDPGRELLQWGPAVMVGLFLLVWLTLWTFGGFAAGSELLRLLWGEDRITVASGRLTVTWLRGPFRSSRAFDRDAIRRIAVVGTAGRLSLGAGRERVVLSGLGTRAERDEAVAALRIELGLSPEAAAATAAIPQGWEEVITPEGERVLVTDTATRRTQARVASVVTLLFAAVTLVLGRESVHHRELLVPAFLVCAFTIALTTGTVWLARGRWEWKLGGQRLTLRRRYGSRVRDVFEARRLVLDRTLDSDGDPWIELLAQGDAQAVLEPATSPKRLRPSANRRRIVRVMDDDGSVRELGAWLARGTGLALEDRTTPQARAIELIELRAALASSGRFGQWLAKAIDRLAERKRSAGPPEA